MHSSQLRLLLIASLLLSIAGGVTQTRAAPYAEQPSTSAAQAPAAPGGGGSSLLFNNNYVEITNSSTDLDANAYLSIEAWVKVGNADNDQILVSKMSAMNKGYLIRVVNRTLQATVYTVNGTEKTLTSPANSIQANHWYHVALTWDSDTSGDPIMKIYINGEQVDSQAAGTNNMSTNQVNLVLGAASWDPTQSQLFGYLDEVRVWRVQRTQAEIRESMHRSLQALPTPQDNLAAYWTFDEGSGTTVDDSSASALYTTNDQGTLLPDTAPPQWQASTTPFATSISELLTGLAGVWSSKAENYSSIATLNSTLTPDDFILFGHDNADLLFSPLDVPEGVGQRLQRAWKVETNTSPQTATLTFDVSKLLISTGYRLQLLVDDDGVFADSTVVTGTYVPEDQQFIVSDYAFPDAEYFTLAERHPEGGAGPGGVGLTDGSSHLELWLRADRGTGQDADGSAIDSWADISGNGIDVAQSTADAQPSYNATDSINSQPVVSFDGDDVLARSNTDLNLIYNQNAFIVKQDSSAADTSYFKLAGSKPSDTLVTNPGLRMYTGGPTDAVDKYYARIQNTPYPDHDMQHAGLDTTNPNFMMYQRAGFNIAMARNGEAPVFDADSYGGQLFLGDNPALEIGPDAFSGNIAEVIVFSEWLHHARRHLVENYLSAKYNIAIDTDWYAGDEPSLGDYDFDVAGIARDIDGDNDFAVAGGMVMSNTTFLQDVDDHLLFGNNGISATTVISDVPDGVGSRWSRTWYLDRTDTNANGGNVQIAFDFGDIGLSTEPHGPYVLLYRASTTEGFVGLPVESTVEGDRVVFDALDASLLNDGYYTLGTVAPNLVVDKQASSDAVVAGTGMTYTIVISNTGGNATDVMLADMLPSGVQVVTDTVSQDNCAGSETITCTLGGLRAGEGITVELQVWVEPTARDTLTNTAVVSSSEKDLDSVDNSDTVTTTVDVAADLAISKSVTPTGTIEPGAPLTYTLSITNIGPSALITSTTAPTETITVTDTLPDGLTFQSAAGDGWDCSESGGALTCSRVGMEVDATSAITVAALAPESGETITNTASVTSTVSDPDLNNNSAQVTSEVAGEADLVLSKVDDPDPVFAGDMLTYTLTLTNTGPTTATNVVLTDTLPLDVTFVSASHDSCVEDAGTVTCALGMLGSGASMTVTLNVEVDYSAEGPLVNEASVTARQTDPDPATNTAREETLVHYRAYMPLVHR